MKFNIIIVNDVLFDPVALLMKFLRCISLNHGSLRHFHISGDIILARTRG